MASYFPHMPMPISPSLRIYSQLSWLHLQLFTAGMTMKPAYFQRDVCTAVRKDAIFYEAKSACHQVYRDGI